ncbi:putative autophagy-related protein 11 [Euwallacea similis]|uniref:putative autophagy-related protein 11 n=1 Tax=Euwallacea similis TaxID=1736056 RepID=UPI00344C1FCA
MLNILLQSFALTFFLTSSQAQDLLGLFKPKPNLPQELNDFLNDVQQHKRDFAFIRHAVKNQKIYDKNYQEAPGLLVEDVENQFNLNSDIANKNSGEGNSFSDFFEEEEEGEEQHHPYDEEEGTIYAGFESPRFKKHYPNERYSRNIRSPIRLRRELEEGFRSKHKLDENPNKQFGYIRITDQKYCTQSNEEENHVMKVNKQNATKKKKRKDEISIANNEKLVKHFEEDEDGPKSTVLNIKVNNALTSRKPSENSTLTKNKNLSSPENNESILNTDDNSQNNQNKKNNVLKKFLSAKNNLDSSRILGEILPEVGKVNTSHQAIVEHLNTIYNYFKQSGQSSHIIKSIDVAQNNFNNFNSKKQGVKYDLNEDKKENAEKMQDIVMDGTGVSQAKEKFLTRKNQGYDYFDPQDLVDLEAGFTKNVPPANTPICATLKKQEAGNILHVENTQCRTAEEERFKIITSKEDNEESTTKTIHIEHKHNYNQRKTDQRREKQRNFRVEYLAAIRDRKHLPRIAKYKRKRVGQHPKKKKRIDREIDHYDLNHLYESPKNGFDYIPSYRRALKEIDYDYSPHAIQDIDGEHYQDSQVVHNKFKTEGDYSEEEDMMTSNTFKKMPVKKTQNQFAMNNNEQTTEGNDDDYDYSDLTDMKNEDEDVSFEDVDNDKLDINEAADNNRSDHDVYENVKKLVEVTTEHISSGSVIMNLDDMLWETDQVLLGAYSHRGKKTNKKSKVLIRMYCLIVDESKDIREKRASAGEKRKRKIRRQRKRLKAKHSDESEKTQFQEKPLTDQEKQDIFLRYNPDFQRWPRFVQDDQKFHEMIHRRGLEDYQKYIGQNFVKRAEPTSETATSASSETESDPIQLQSAETEDSSSTVFSSSSNDKGTVPAFSWNDESTVSSDSPNVESEATSSETEASFNGTETLPPEAASSDDDAPTIDTALVTANSDIFGNVTVPELGTQQGGNGNNINAASGVGSTVTEFEVTEAVSNSTEYQFNTITEDLTQIKQCSNMTQEHIKPCDDENANHNPGTVTSVLPLAKEAATESLNLTKEQFLDLDDILVGMLPKDVVLESLSTARGSVRNGLKSARYNVNLMNIPLSTYNSSAESSMLFIEMSNLIKKSKYHSSCQTLPTNLQTYLKTITKNEVDDPMTKLKEMNEIDLDNHQSDYMFHSEQNDKIYEKAQVLRELLRKYQNLPADGKKEVEPVKKYIDSHLAMIEQMGGDKTEEPTALPISKYSSTQPKEEKEISVVDADEEMKLQDKMKEEGTAFTSPQFGKLAKAVRNVRSNRQVIKRIEEIYGRDTLDKSKEDLIENNENGFESPRIINF